LFKRVIAKYYVYFKLAKTGYVSYNQSRGNMNLSKESWGDGKKKKKGTKGYFYKDNSEFADLELDDYELYNCSIKTYNSLSYLNDIFENVLIDDQGGQLNVSSLVDDSNEKPFFLKLNGANNMCYSNVILQAVLFLGKDFNEKVILSPFFQNSQA
jgi:hypothetical protein